ncbi:MAG: tetratricopeptide repeat protein [Acidobacteriota bacterium]|nr:hypothetical protein [Thermoanaerobaculaceae bacterium]
MDKTDLTLVYVSPEVTKGMDLIERGELSRAYNFFQNYAEQEPNNPIPKSFLGYLTAVFQKKTFQGLELCLEAVKMEKEEPLLYLNLARVYVLMNDRYHAFQAIQTGLKYRHSPFRSDLMNFYRHIGIRKKPPISFLHRDNPLNVVIGKMLRKKR